MIQEKKLKLCTCERCGYVWIPSAIQSDDKKIKQKIPTGCAKCKTRIWNTPISKVPLRSNTK